MGGRDTAQRVKPGRGAAGEGTGGCGRGLREGPGGGSRPLPAGPWRGPGPGGAPCACPLLEPLGAGPKHPKIGDFGAKTAPGAARAPAGHIQRLWWAWVLSVGPSHDTGGVFLAARTRCCVSGMRHPSPAVLHSHGPALSVVPTAFCGGPPGQWVPGSCVLRCETGARLGRTGAAVMVRAGGCPGEVVGAGFPLSGREEAEGCPKAAGDSRKGTAKGMEPIPAQQQPSLGLGRLRLGTRAPGP